MAAHVQPIITTHARATRTIDACATAALTTPRYTI